MIYLDSLDSFYSINHESEEMTKPKKDYAGIGAIIFTFTVLSIVIGLSIYTAWQIAYGQEVNNSQLYDEMSKPQIDSRLVNLTKIEHQLDNLKVQMNTLVDKKQSIESVVNYCFAHVDRPNPIQDLIDKGFASEEFKNLTCKDVNLAYDTNQIEIATLQLKINQVVENQTKEISKIENSFGR